MRSSIQLVLRNVNPDKSASTHLATLQRRFSIIHASKTALGFRLANDPAEGHENDLTISEFFYPLVVGEHREGGDHARYQVEVVQRLREGSLGRGIGQGEGVVEYRKEGLERLRVIHGQGEISLWHGCRCRLGVRIFWPSQNGWVVGDERG
jgi:hypothetical protein